MDRRYEVLSDALRAELKSVSPEAGVRFESLLLWIEPYKNNLRGDSRISTAARGRAAEKVRECLFPYVIEQAAKMERVKTDAKARRHIDPRKV